MYSKSINYWLCDEAATAEVIYAHKSINEEYYKIVNGYNCA